VVLKLGAGQDKVTIIKPPKSTLSGGILEMRIAAKTILYIGWRQSIRLVVVALR